MNDPTSVYLYYDHARRLIYVGITSRGPLRQAEHLTQSEWWQFVAHQDVEHYDDREAALRRERELIETNRPPFNRQHNGEWEPIKKAYLRVVNAEANLVEVQAGRESFLDRIEDDHEWKVFSQAYDAGVHDAWNDLRGRPASRESREEFVQGMAAHLRSAE